MAGLERVGAGSYLALLQDWAGASERFDYKVPGQDGLICFGSGYNGWGVQTNQKAFSGLAALAVADGLDEKAAGMSRERILERTLGMLRFSLASHIEGDYCCMEGQKWGHTWISCLGIERMMHAVEAVEEFLTDADRALLRKVLVSEADWLLENLPVEGGIDARLGHNKPESNIWNGALMHRAAAMYPDEANAGCWREKGTKFLLNGISMPCDADGQQMFAGKALKDWHVGPNFTEDLGLHHHAYLNVGYMVICLSNIAMVHFTFKSKGWEMPVGLYHHAEELWGFIKQLTFADGRLLRIGGDTRVRYCYCQDYMIPMWLWAVDYLGDKNAASFEAGWLEQLAVEKKANGDGMFLSERCGQMAEESELYYTRLETDRAATLGMGAYWRQKFDISGEVVKKDVERFAWNDEFHGGALHGSERRLASFVWQGAEQPMGLVLTPDASDMAEWRSNLCGEMVGEGAAPYYDVVSYRQAKFDGGFATWGSLGVGSWDMLAEGQSDDLLLAWEGVVFAALPDDATVMIMQFARMHERRGYFKAIKSGLLHVPNDMFNGKQRQYYGQGNQWQLAGVSGEKEIVATGSSWLNVEDKVSLVAGYGVDQWRINRPGERQVGLKRYRGRQSERAGGMLYTDEICGKCELGLQTYGPGETLFDVGFVVQAGVEHGVTGEYCSAGSCKGLAVDDADLRVMQAKGQDGKDYVLAANFGLQDRVAQLKGLGRLRDLASGESSDTGQGLLVPARGARVLVAY